MAVKNVSLKYLAKNHKDFEFTGKPALVLCHMQNNLVGAKGNAMPGWIPKAKIGINESGMIGQCKILADAFRANGYPVIFVQADGNPLKGAVPKFGEMFRQIEQSGDYFTQEEYNYLWGVIDEMEYDPKKDFYLINWYASAFALSGLELTLRSQGCDTIVWGGFAQNSVIYSSCIGAVDNLFSNVVPVDASYVCVPGPYSPEEQERADNVVSEAIVRFMAPAVAHLTDTDTVLDKFKKLPILK